MSVTSLVVRRIRLLWVAIPLLSGHLNAQRMVMPALPAPPTAKEALYGSIAPDGRSFVYEVLEGADRYLWRLDLGSLHAERVTQTPGFRFHPVWAADSKHLAFWRHPPLNRSVEDSDGLYVLDLNTGNERRVLESTPSEGAYAGELSWLADGRIFYWHMLQRPRGGMDFGRFKLTAMRPDGKVTALPAAWLNGGDFDVISPSGSAEAYVRSCCGGARQAIWVRTASGARCVVGPMVPGGQVGRPVSWSRDDKRLYLVAHHDFTSPDTIDHAYAIDLQRSMAWRIGPVDKPIGSVSVSEAGDVALTQLPYRGRVASLWILPASTIRVPTPGAERLGNCPPIEKSIAEFVRRANLKNVLDIYPLLEDSSMRLTFFSVTYGDAFEIHPRRMGVRFGSRVGWIGTADLCETMPTLDSMQRAVSCFPLRTSDAYLFSDSLAARLHNAWDAGDFWRVFLLRNSATPFSVVVREMRHDPRNLAGVALGNPLLFRDTIPFALRLELAALEDTLASALVHTPSVRTDPERLAQIMNIPMYRSGEGLAAWRVTQQLQTLMPSLVANARQLSEGAALQVYMAEESAVTWDSMRMTMLHTLSPNRSRVILGLAAERDWNPRAASPDFARAKLFELGTTPERELADAVRRVHSGELPGNLPAFMLSSLMHAPWSVLDEISRLDERFRPVRARAALRLAAEPSTPDSVIGLLTLGLSRHADPALAQQLLQRPHADTSRALLRALSHLESIMYGVTARQARERLAILEPTGPPSRAIPHSPPPPPPTPTAPAPSWSGESGETDQCLAPDDWSEQLRGAIGIGAQLLAGDSLCIRAAGALDRAFQLPGARDSAYVFGVADGFVLAFPPSRPDAEVTLVRFDRAFAERLRRVVRVQ